MLWEKHLCQSTSVFFLLMVDVLNLPSDETEAFSKQLKAGLWRRDPTVTEGFSFQHSPQNLWVLWHRWSTSEVLVLRDVRRTFAETLTLSVSHPPSDKHAEALPGRVTAGPGHTRAMCSNLLFSLMAPRHLFNWVNHFISRCLTVLEQRKWAFITQASPSCGLNCKGLCLMGSAEEHQTHTSL